MTTDDTPQRTTREDVTVLVDFCRKASGLPAIYGTNRNRGDADGRD